MNYYYNENKNIIYEVDERFPVKKNSSLVYIERDVTTNANDFIGYINEIKQITYEEYSTLILLKDITIKQFLWENKSHIYKQKELTYSYNEEYKVIYIYYREIDQDKDNYLKYISKEEYMTYILIDPSIRVVDLSNKFN